MSVTAIFGGTFNPFHIGHYQMMSALQNDNGIDKILLVPDRIPPHKVCDYLADDKDRIEMCRAIVADFPKAELSLIEFERNGKSYSYDTVKELLSRYPNTEFSFVCGGDMLVSFDRWYRYEELMRLVPFIVFRRTDNNSGLFERKVDEFRLMGMKITVMDDIITAVSSSEVRSSIKESENLLPEKIYNYITDRGIYGE